MPSIIYKIRKNKGYKYHFLRNMSLYNSGIIKN